MTRARLVILIVVLGASALNGWYYGLAIYDDRAHANDAWYRERTAGENPFLKLSTTDSEAAWLAAERTAWRKLGAIQIAIVTVGAVGFVIASRRPSSAPGVE